LEKNKLEISLFKEVKQIIEQSRLEVAKKVNSTLTAMYWQIGKKINEVILNNERAEYGKRTLKSLSIELTREYGAGFNKSSLTRMINFYNTFPNHEIVATLWQQLSWSHFRILITIKNDLERDFYTQFCKLENWSVRTLKKKIDGMLFTRTAISKKPDELIKNELQKLKDTGKLTPDLVFRDPYVLDFLNLKNMYSEKDLESSIIREIESFILELGIGFTFVARQKRMIIDGLDFKLDLLFYHRKLKRLVAIELKLGKFKPQYKGQMELYLRWLEKYEMEDGEEQPIGLILCAEGSKEQIELLQLDKSNIKVSEYITQYLPKELLAKKLQQFIKD